VLLARAAQIDAGFDVRVLADMIATLDRFTDSEIPVPDGSSKRYEACSRWRALAARRLTRLPQSEVLCQTRDWFFEPS
jgi:hypothetical protein